MSIMPTMPFGINLGFTGKRLPAAHEWARFVREKLALDLVQFSFDLIDPWTPNAQRLALAKQVQQAVNEWGIQIHSAQVGLACYSYNGLLHPELAARQAALEWWLRSVDLTAELGVDTVGGPIGALSMADAANPEVSQQLYRDMLDSLVTISQAAKRAGLRALLVEPTPLKREFPYTSSAAVQLQQDLAGRTAVPVEYVLDIGHALYQPLHGARASLEEWFKAIGQHIGVLHLQNTDFQSDSHWGWPDARGIYDVAQYAQQVARAKLTHVPTFLEVFYPFELDDDAVLNNVISSVEHCKSALTLLHRAG